MKRLLCLMLILSLCLPALTGCRRRERAAAPEGTPEPTATPQAGMGYTVTSTDQQPSVPDPLATLTPQQRAAMSVGANGGDVTADMLPPGGDQSAGEQPAPTEEITTFDTYDEAAEAAREAAQPAPINASAFQFSAVTDEKVDFTFNYPSDWENVPGIYTVCYRQKVGKGEFPARIAVTRKKLVHTPDEIVMNEQMTSYLKSIAKQYDSETFQIGTAVKDVPFIRRKGIANTYLAYWGSVEVKGYVLGVAVDRTLYVLHFCAAYTDYAELEGALEYMVSTVQLHEDPKDKKKKR